MHRLSALALTIGLVAACAGPNATKTPTGAPTSAPAATPAGSLAASATAVDVTLQDFKIVPATTLVPGNVTFNVHSNGPTPHNFNLRDASGAVVLSSKDLHTGDSDVVSGQLAPGTYTFFCAFPGHESLGMHGTLTVS
jgi:plastocyanin